MRTVTDPLDSPPNPWWPETSTMARQLRSLGSATPLGPVEHWSASLKAVLGILFASASPMFVLWGRDRLWFSNDAFLPFLGPCHRDALTRPARTVWPELLELLGAQADHLLSTGVPFRLEQQQLLREHEGRAEETWQTIACVPILEEGRSSGLFGTLVDDTTRVRQDTEPADLAPSSAHTPDSGSLVAAKDLASDLRESEERLRLAVQGANLGTWDLDLTTGTLRWSQRTRDIFGLQPGTSVVLETFYAAVHPDDRQRLWQQRNEALNPRGHGNYEVEYRIRRPDGSERWIASHGQGYFAGTGEARRAVRFAGTLRDISARKQTEEALRDARSRLDAALIAGAIVTWSWDAVTDQVFGDDGLARLFALSREDVSGGPIERFLEQIHPADRAQVRIRLQAALDEDSDFEADYRVRGSDGVDRTLASRGRVRREAGRGSVRLSGVLVDITERKKVEEALRQSEERFRLAAEAINGIISDYDLRTGIAQRTRGLFEVLGYRPEEVPATGEWWRQQIHPEDLPEADAALAAAIASGEDRVVAAYRLRHRNGRWLRVVDRSVLVRAADGSVVRLVGCTVNVTEQRLMVEALAEREALYRTLTDAMPQIVYTTWPDGRSDYANRRWFDFTCTTPQQNQGPEWEACLHPEDLARVRVLWTHSLQTGFPFEVELRYRRADGVYRWHLSRALPVRNELGQVIKWVGTATDVDDFKRAEEALKEADRRKDEFLATLAHELRNPLAPVRNTLQLVRQACRPEPAVQQPLEMMDRQVNQMVRLLDDLLDVSRITRGKIQVRKERVNLAAVVNLAVETSRPLLEGARHELTLTLPPEPLFLEADPTRLAQVLSNLLNNAARYTNPGGRIFLSVERDGGEVVVRVRDTGIGIPEAMLTRVFEMFTQVDRTSDRSQGGLGIGLTLVQRLVKKHGGSVEARSPGPGQGSEFVVRLPLVMEERRRKERARPPGFAPSSFLLHPSSDAESPTLAVGGPEKPAGAGRRILLADDNHDAVESLAMLLQVSGHQTCLAYDGQEALEKALTWRPDVALLDIGMPKLSGHEVARRLRAQPEFHDLILVALTGWGQEDDRRRSREAGFDHHLVKPCDLAVLYSLLSEGNG
jgi:PAS domain S-box-containing protein